MRQEAVKRGLDPGKSFNNVEVVTAEKIGIETTTCVCNIYSYTSRTGCRSTRRRRRKRRAGRSLRRRAEQPLSSAASGEVRAGTRSKVIVLSAPATERK